jgi:hypothetical protein
MKLRAACVVAGFLSLALSVVPLTFAQTPAETAPALPRLVRFGGTVKDLNGTPLTGVVGITFALYSEQTGGAALWLETQNVTADSNGHYVVLLGSTTPDGLPADLFTSERAHWVGVQVSGQAEQPRVLLVSAPYAFRARDAETVGGLPPSAFMLANGPQGAAGGAKGASAPASAGAQKNSAPPANPDVTGKGTVEYIPMWDTTGDIIDSVIFQENSEIGIGGSVTIDNGNLYLNKTVNSSGPEIHWEGYNGSWLIGIDVHNPPYEQDFVPAAKILYCQPNTSNCNPTPTSIYTEYSVHDLIYIHHGGTNPPTVGIGVTPPNESNRLQIAAQEDYPSMGTMLLYRSPSQTGNIITVMDTAGNTYWYMDNNYNTYMSGNLTVTGSLSVSGTKNFKIDDPIDPANKYLYHSTVESAEMMNVYSGNVVLDNRGEAEVNLPTWFEALNKDFRYQLTCIGGFGPVYVAHEISNNKFHIAGGKPGLKVSWQVTAIRHDAYAEAYGSPVEVEKPTGERGHYLHPELFPVPPQEGAKAPQVR